MFELTGRQAVITGGASGIGLAVAELFAQQGARVVVMDREEARAAEAAERLGGQAVGVDVSDEASVREAFASVEGRLDVLVNCAGIAHVGQLTTTSVEDMDRLYAVNVRGTYLCMRAAVERMLETGGGAIVNMASIAATAGIADRFAYSMTKGAVLAMTLSVAKDYLARGIRCNCVSPARVHTPFVDGFLKKNYPGQEEEKMKVLAAAQPIGRMGRPDEVAALALYLASDAAGFVTGCDYPIDGGFFNLR